MEMMTFSTITTMINPMDELTILGEEAMSVLVRTPDGEEVMMKRERMTNYLLPQTCLLYTSPSPRDRQKSRMPSSA